MPKVRSYSVFKVLYMKSARRYIPTNSVLFTQLVRYTYGIWLKRAYNIHAEGLEVFSKIKPPFLVVGNHATLLDPFIANAFMPYPIHWVASDGNMRNPIMRFLLIKLVGSIPKSKAIPDIETVNWIVNIIRKQKGVVGFYPEGQSSWNGSSLPSFGSSAKLIKLLKVPVIAANSRGAYMTKPRWAYTRRSGGVIVQFSELFSPEQCKALSVEELDAALNESIYHDDIAWCQQTGRRYDHPQRAECLELALFACPSCGALNTLASEGTEIRCHQCGFSAEYQPDGSFSAILQGQKSPIADAPDFFRSLKNWDLWQHEHLARLIQETFSKNPEKIIFQDADAILLEGKRMDTMRRIGRGTLTLTADRLELARSGSVIASFPCQDIEGPGVLKWNFFEFYVGKKVYRVRFRNRNTSGRKYASALELLLKMPH